MATEAEVKAWVAENRKVMIDLGTSTTSQSGYAVQFNPATVTIVLDDGSNMYAELDKVHLVSEEALTTEVEAEILTAIGGGAQGRAIMANLKEAGIVFSKNDGFSLTRVKDK